MESLVGGAVKPGGEDVVTVAVVQRRRWPVAELSVASHAPSLDRLGFRDCWRGVGGSGEPRALCPGPHLSFYGAVRRGPPIMERLGAPDQGADPRARANWKRSI